MALSLYQSSIPVLAGGLKNLSSYLAKGEELAQRKNVDSDRLLQQRLIFDMFPLIKQIQIACDTAARSAARLAGVEAMPFPDTETTFAQAQARIAAALAYVESFTAPQIDRRDTATVSFKMGGRAVELSAHDYLFKFGLPNFYFHCTTAYNILRVAGAEIGKHDFLGF